MIRYECDFCRRLKVKGEAWILGFAAENVGVTAARREVSILPEWDEARAVDFLAVHFCSEPCRRRYMAAIFGEQPAETEVVEEVAVIPQKRVVRSYPGTTVETRVVRRKTRAKARNRRRRKAA